jgi:hypothetical protein
MKDRGPEVAYRFEQYAELRGLTEHAVPAGGITGEHALEREGKQQVTMFDAPLVRVLKQFARPRNPNLPSFEDLAVQVAKGAAFELLVRPQKSFNYLGTPFDLPARRNENGATLNACSATAPSTSELQEFRRWRLSGGGGRWGTPCGLARGRPRRAASCRAWRSAH